MSNHIYSYKPLIKPILSILVILLVIFYYVAQISGYEISAAVTLFFGFIIVKLLYKTKYLNKAYELAISQPSLTIAQEKEYLHNKSPYTPTHLPAERWTVKNWNGLDYSQQREILKLYDVILVDHITTNEKISNFLKKINKENYRKYVSMIHTSLDSLNTQSGSKRRSKPGPKRPEFFSQNSSNTFFSSRHSSF